MSFFFLIVDVATFYFFGFLINRRAFSFVPFVISTTRNKLGAFMRVTIEVINVSERDNNKIYLLKKGLQCLYAVKCSHGVRGLEKELPFWKKEKEVSFS